MRVSSYATNTGMTIALASITGLTITTTLISSIVLFYQAIQTRENLTSVYLNPLITLINANQRLRQRFPQTLADIKDPTK